MIKINRAAGILWTIFYFHRTNNAFQIAPPALSWLPTTTVIPIENEMNLFNLEYKSQRAKLGSNYKLKCLLLQRNEKNEENPIMRFWTVDSRVPDGIKYKILPDSNLLIRNISKGDYGKEYFCHAIIPGQNTVESMQIGLSPFTLLESLERDGKSLPESQSEGHVKDQVQLHEGIIGELKTLSCAVHARPSPKFRWFHKNGTFLQDETDFTIETDKDNSNLTIFLRSPSYYGEYICEAWNNLGNSSQRFQLVMPQRPKDIPFIFPKSIEISKITLGVLNFKNSNYSLQIQYKEAIPNDDSWTSLSSTSSSPEQMELDNLKGNTTYLIRAGFKNRFVVGNYSEAIRVTTDTVKEPDFSPLNINRTSKSLDFNQFHEEMFNETDSQKVVNWTTWTSKTFSKSGDKIKIQTIIYLFIYLSLHVKSNVLNTVYKILKW